MKIYEMVRAADWKYVSQQFSKLYPDYIDSIDGYEKAYSELQSIEPNPSSRVFDIEYVEGHLDNYHDCYFTDPADKQKYGLDFMDWADVMGLELSGNVFRTYSAYQICAHLIWEITFYGFSDEDVKQEKAKLDQIAKENIS